MTASRQSLLSMLESGSDVELAFTAADGSTEIVPGHLFTLKLWSKVLAAALEVARSSNSSSSGAIKIPMHGTSKEDWLLAMEFVYPVVPQPIVTRDNLEPLLALGDKYCMPALQSRVGDFLLHHTAELNLTADSPRFVWKWIYTADKYGLGTVAMACIASQNAQSLFACCPVATWQEKLSVNTLQHLLALATTSIKAPAVCRWCSRTP